MSQDDMSDALRGGATMDDVRATAEAGLPPADVGLAVLEALEAEVRAAEDKQGRAKALVDCFERRESRLAIVAAAMNAGPEYEARLEVLRAIRGMDAPVGRLRKRIAEEVKRQRRGIREVGEFEVPTLGELVGLDLGQMTCPAGWAARRDGIYIEVPGEDGGVVLKRVAYRPCVVTAVLSSLVDDSERARVAWQRMDRTWSTAIVPKSSLKDTRKIVQLADQGLDVASTSARQIVAWLAAQEGHNADEMPREYVSDVLGWQGEGGIHGYLLGGRRIGGQDDAPVHLDVDEGREQIASAYRAAGTLEGWRKAVTPAMEHPSAALAVYASLVAPMLGILTRAPNAILDWSGETSRGKTTCLSLAASVWGTPAKGGHLVHSWDNTAVFIERAAAFCGHLPLILDDTKDVRDVRAIERVIYSYSGGSGRGRASIDGLRRTVDTRGILLSTGEQPVTAFGSAAGARARVLSLRGLPFGDGDQGELVEGVLAGIADHHGTAGPAVVDWLDRHRDAWESLREVYASRVEKWKEAAEGAVLARLSAIVALLECGAWLAHDVLAMPRPERDALAYAWEAAAASAIDADRPKAAMEAVWSWASAHQTEFFYRGIRERDGAYRVPLRGWVGSWKQSQWTEIAWYPEALERVLRFQGFLNPEEILSAWQERGWILMDGRHRTRHRSVDGERARLVVLPRAIIEPEKPDESEPAPVPTL